MYEVLYKVYHQTHRHVDDIERAANELNLQNLDYDFSYLTDSQADDIIEHIVKQLEKTK